MKRSWTIHNDYTCPLDCGWFDDVLVVSEITGFTQEFLNNMTEDDVIYFPDENSPLFVTCEVK